jgi:hypothetical protein
MTTSPSSSLSLYTIEASLQLLAETREAAEAEGDAAAVTECDKALASYLTAEASKVNSYAALIRRQTAEAEECEAEAARLTARAKQRRAFVDRLKSTALEVMQRFGVRELRSATNTLRVQNNGGVQPLDTSGVVDAKWQKITVTLPALVWLDLMGLAEAAARDSETYRMLDKLTDRAPRSPDTDLIRKALAVQERCPECKGVGAPWNNSASVPCARCNGTGWVHPTIPGARLLERGVHLRCE